MEVVGQTRGYHLEPEVTPSQVPPVADSVAVADSIPAPDTIPVDTAAAVSPPADTVGAGRAQYTEHPGPGAMALPDDRPTLPTFGPPGARWAKREDPS
jgi:hypothetical protein